MIPGIESLACGPLAVPDDVMAHVVHVESSRNPFAIGVVGGRLLRQPRNLGEAVATVRMLEARGYNYSVGLAQVNRVNFERFGLEAPGPGSTSATTSLPAPRSSRSACSATTGVGVMRSAATTRGTHGSAMSMATYKRCSTR